LVGIGAITGGSCFASNGFGGSGGFGSGRIGGGSFLAGNGLLIFSIPLRAAFGGGVFIFKPPPPPPPPGPGDTRNTMRTGSGSFNRSVRSSATAKPRLAMNSTAATARPCRLVETISGTVVERSAAWPCANNSRPRPSAPGTATVVPCLSAFTARTASAWLTNPARLRSPAIGSCAAIERISPRARSASTRASGTPAAAAMSRGL
jgi:hypothetical protein